MCRGKLNRNQNTYPIVSPFRMDDAPCIQKSSQTQAISLDCINFLAFYDIPNVELPLMNLGDHKMGKTKDWWFLSMKPLVWIIKDLGAGQKTLVPVESIHLNLPQIKWHSWSILSKLIKNDLTHGHLGRAARLPSTFSFHVFSSLSNGINFARLVEFLFSILVLLLLPRIA